MQARSRRQLSKRFGQMGSHLTTAKFTLSRHFPDALDGRDCRLMVIGKRLNAKTFWQPLTCAVQFRCFC